MKTDDSTGYTLRIKDTKLGEMVNVHEIASCNPLWTNMRWIRIDDIKGFSISRERNDKEQFHIYLSTTEGRGLNGVVSYIEVSEECYCTVLHYIMTNERNDK